jgi:threonine dehydrogenase-like Zn-dependent dehydrogenase
MNALIYDGQLKFAPDCADPKPAADEVMVKVTLAGICQTDIEITKGYMNFRGVIGHEFVGVVATSGGTAGDKWKGKRVVGEINCICGKCEMCLAGLKAHCLKRTTIGIAGHDGCLAERLVLPAANLHAVPDNVSDAQAVLVEPLAAAFQVTQQMPPSPKEKAVVIGDGRLAQLIAQVLVSRGARPLVIGINENKMRRLERLGISCLLASEARPRHDAHLVVEASGSLAGFTQAMEFVRPRGTIVLKSTIAATGGINLSPLVVDEICVLGSRCGPFGEALASLARGEIDLEGLITAEYPLKDGVKAIAAAQAPDALKIVVRP